LEKNQKINLMKFQAKRFARVDPDKVISKKYGERYDSYRKIWSSINSKNIPKFPPHIDFELFDKCNQSCVMCARNEKLHPNIEYNINTKTKLPFTLFEKIINEGETKSLYSVNFGAFSEPFVHPECLRMVKYAHDHGIVDTRIITNALLLQKNINEIFASGLTQLFISIDAFSEKTYEKIRGKGFNHVIKNALDFLEERNRRKSELPIVRVSFVEMEANKHEKDSFINFWKEKADFVDIQVYQNENESLGENLNQPKKFDCDSPFGRVSVLADGSVIPCCNFYGRSLKIGNAFEESIEKIWTSEKMKLVREKLESKTSSTCETCQRA